MRQRVQAWQYGLVNGMAVLCVAGGLALGGCGGDSESGSAPAAPDARDASPVSTPESAGSASAKKRRTGTRIEVRGSEYGPMLFDVRRQAIYIFENDPKGKSVCYGECATAWPPVLTRGKPKAGKRVKSSLLGTIRRRDGKRQVTYAGKPLYFYAHEDPGEVLCHNVDLNGGLWWVVGPDGKPRP